MHELLHRAPSISFAVTDFSELVYDVNKFESEKLLNPPNLVKPFYVGKMTFEKLLFSRKIFKKN
jgi:hypothetical protein